MFEERYKCLAKTLIMLVALIVPSKLSQKDAQVKQFPLSYQIKCSTKVGIFVR